MKEDIYKLIKDYGNVSFVELRNRIDGFNGDLEITARSNSNIILWNGVSDKAFESIISLMNEGKIIAKPTTPLVYIADGGMLRLPIVKRNQQYKTPHWLPVVFVLMKENVNQ